MIVSKKKWPDNNSWAPGRKITHVGDQDNTERRWLDHVHGSNEGNLGILKKIVD
jgi:hypothetical protein